MAEAGEATRTDAGHVPAGLGESGAPSGAAAGSGEGSEDGAVDLAARVAELEAELGRLRQEQWLGDALREASQRAGVEIGRDDARLANADTSNREAYQAAVEVIVREEVARREGAAEVEALRARVAELEERLANPRRDTFDTGTSGPAAAELSDAPALEKIRFGLR
jgi:outer membrane murein-binding lipoprotein Lpp